MIDRIVHVNVSLFFLAAVQKRLLYSQSHLTTLVDCLMIAARGIHKRVCRRSSLAFCDNTGLGRGPHVYPPPPPPASAIISSPLTLNIELDSTFEKDPCEKLLFLSPALVRECQWWIQFHWRSQPEIWVERHSIVLLVNGVTDSIFIAKEDLVNVVNPHVPSTFLWG